MTNTPKAVKYATNQYTTGGIPKAYPLAVFVLAFVNRLACNFRLSFSSLSLSTDIGAARWNVNRVICGGRLRTSGRVSRFVEAGFGCREG